MKKNSLAFVLASLDKRLQPVQRCKPWVIIEKRGAEGEWTHDGVPCDPVAMGEEYQIVAVYLSYDEPDLSKLLGE